MPAKLDLLPRKKFEITLEDGTVIKGQFGTWALFRFCKKKGIGLEGISNLLNGLQIEDVTELVLCAVEQSAREDGKEVSYTDVDVCKWVDEIGGGMGMALVTLLSHYIGDEESEKKSNQLKEELPSPGQASSESQQAAV